MPLKMSHFLSKSHFEERPKSDQKHDQNTTKCTTTTKTTILTEKNLCRVGSCLNKTRPTTTRSPFWSWSVPTLDLGNFDSKFNRNIHEPICETSLDNLAETWFSCLNKACNSLLNVIFLQIK